MTSLRASGRNHYLKLPGANVVATDALLVTKENLARVIEKQAMMCVYGESGVGKTLSVNECLADVAPQQTLRMAFGEYPRPRDVRHTLFEALDLPGRPPRRPYEFTRLLKEELSRQFRVLVCDEAQWLSRECFELYRHLWDHETTQIAIVFVGGAGCYQVLSNEPMLASRIYIWQEYTRMSREQVQSAIPAFHPLWEKVSAADIDVINKRAAHGRFRDWAKITSLAVEEMQSRDSGVLDEGVLEWVFSKDRN
ncbi:MULTISPECIES: ATP-binding protein [unclassified Actinomadura]|uniref:ATP-binding protein n=1 Tax=unclassified Actinomadura TaxID=2626254 RepID=UPI001591C5FF|nr:ATP-binding protein [Actinomadura sp. NAK00032]QKW36232.1 ATP-binding protein [Actinomadura sp. NAK00032]